MADGGTLFLDEIGNLPLMLQAKLLRALQERAVVPLGGSKPVPFRARLVAATNADLLTDVAAGRFRTDLYHRLAEFTIALPPLRERREDVLHFARRFLAEANDELGRNVRGMTPAAEHLLLAHGWPGNLRELRNAVRRAALLAASPDLDAGDFELTPATVEPPADAARTVAAPQDDGPLAERLRAANDAMEAAILRQTLAACDGNKAAAARTLQIDYTTLHRKLKRHGLAS
jgi:two-component system, NtrC family, response regulator HydG